MYLYKVPVPRYEVLHLPRYLDLGVGCIHYLGTPTLHIRPTRIDSYKYFHNGRKQLNASKRVSQPRLNSS